MRVSKADGSQTTDLQRDALIAAGIVADHIYEDRASGKLDARPDWMLLCKLYEKVTPWLSGSWTGLDGISGTWSTQFMNWHREELGLKFFLGMGLRLIQRHLPASWCSASLQHSQNLDGISSLNVQKLGWHHLVPAEGQVGRLIK